MSAVDMRHLKPRYWKLSGAISRSGSQKDTQPRQEARGEGYSCPEPSKEATWARFRKERSLCPNNAGISPAKPNAEDDMNCANTRCEPPYLDAPEQMKPERSHLASPAR
ncbi:hypothetical protein AVEN_182101-1 [Araneus ventricosus]|uniref:Uncharacterized protein n=1 Tax=Araneus ventricosus TaxID=182803 RepID=A0A4Y2L0J3_ARAVE|nr:hypothetical protein AVEN_182101-1 [Araneus ventricosus]